MRLDQKVFLLNYATSKSQAQHLIKAGKVLVNDQVVTRPGKIISEAHKITILQKQEYVSRGAYKLLHALIYWKISVKEKICADIGASTGGFTQVLLEHGAKKVYAVDVGKDQLHKKLKYNPRVVEVSETNVKQANLPEKVELLVADLSFISIQKVLESIIGLTKPKSELVLLFKPQFEVGKENLNKKGVSKPEAAQKFLLEFINELSQKFSKVESIESPIKGQDGNTEYLIFVKK
jgi:23S rRNA (cytidine1920-2'-O)/16S rRNA (cytidine1409-2'-O)-methyltransferase